MSSALDLGELGGGSSSSTAVLHPGPSPDPSVADALQVLLNRMRQEGGNAEELYESLRRRLIVFFRLNFPADAEALADRALDRVAGKLLEGMKIDNLPQFTLGVSRMIVAEFRSQRSREHRAHEGYAGMIDPPGTPHDISEGDEDEARIQERVRRLRICLAKLGDHATHVILTYYAWDGSERIFRRRRLAAELGLSLNALRNRALRLRGTLERSLASPPCSARDGTASIDTCYMTTDD